MQPVRLVDDETAGVLLKVSRAYAEQLNNPADPRGTCMSSKQTILQKVSISSGHTDPLHASCVTAVVCRPTFTLAGATFTFAMLQLGAALPVSAAGFLSSFKAVPIEDVLRGFDSSDLEE